MKIHVLTYNPKDAKAKTLFHHTLFGRLSMRNYKGRVTAYYYPGMLDTTRFNRFKNGSVAIENIDCIKHDLLKIFGEYSLLEQEIDGELSLVTGREYWENCAKQKNICFKIRSV